MLKGQNVEWDKTTNRPDVESKKGRMGHNVEWDKTPNRNYVESKKGQLGQNVEWYKKMSKVSNVEIRRHTVMSKKGYYV
jgi:hypothetical protein